jgi:hypothetical protein
VTVFLISVNPSFLNSCRLIQIKHGARSGTGKGYRAAQTRVAGDAE